MVYYYAENTEEKCENEKANSEYTNKQCDIQAVTQVFPGVFLWRPLQWLTKHCLLVLVCRLEVGAVFCHRNQKVDSISLCFL